MTSLLRLIHSWLFIFIFTYLIFTCELDYNRFLHLLFLLVF